MRLRFPALLIAFLLAIPAAADIIDTGTERALFLSGASFKVVIPRGDWAITREQTRTDGRSVYYALSSLQRDMTLWVFIDQTPVCQSAKACLELAMKNKAYDSATDMKFMEHEGFNVVQFTLAAGNDGGKQRHLIAATYVDGAWVDVHLSQTLKSGTDPDSLLAVLKLLSIK